MKLTLIPAIAVVTLAAGLSAQTVNQWGFRYGWNTTYTHRSMINQNEGDLLNRIDNGDFTDWGDDGLGNHAVAGIHYVIQDQDDTTVETYSVVVYPEDPAASDFPDVNNTTGLVTRFGPYNMPATQNNGAIAWGFTFTFGTPVTVPAGQDVFVGVGMPAPPTGVNWPTDGLSTHGLWMYNPSNIPATPPNTHDLPGAQGQPATRIALDTYHCGVVTLAGVPQGPGAYPTTLIQNNFEVRLNSAAGMCLAQTNQLTNYPNSNPASSTNTVPSLGGSNFGSGLHPDVYGFNTGRADDIGFVFTDLRCANGPVFALVSIGGSPIGSVPLNGFGVPAASTGRVCADFTSGTAIFLGVGDATGRAANIMVLSQPVRNTVQRMGSVDVWWQGIGLELDPTTGAFVAAHATGCAIQKL